MTNLKKPIPKPINQITIIDLLINNQQQNRAHDKSVPADLLNKFYYSQSLILFADCVLN